MDELARMRGHRASIVGCTRAHERSSCTYQQMRAYSNTHFDAGLLTTHWTLIATPAQCPSIIQEHCTAPWTLIAPLEQIGGPNRCDSPSDGTKPSNGVSLDAEHFSHLLRRVRRQLIWLILAQGQPKVVVIPCAAHLGGLEWALILPPHSDKQAILVHLFNPPLPLVDPPLPQVPAPTASNVR